MEEQNNMVKSSDLAHLFGLTTRRIQQLTEEGVLIATGAGKQRRYPLCENVQAYIKFWQDKANSTDNAARNLELKKLGAEVDLKESKAKLAKLQVEETEGNLHSAEDVEAVMTDIVINMRNTLLGLPGKLAVDLMGLTAAEISERIRQEVNNVLSDFANYKYEPAVYAQLVRDRQGRRGLVDGDAEDD